MQMRAPTPFCPKAFVGGSLGWETNCPLLSQESYSVLSVAGLERFLSYSIPAASALLAAACSPGSAWNMPGVVLPQGL